MLLSDQSSHLLNQHQSPRQMSSDGERKAPGSTLCSWIRIILQTEELVERWLLMSASTSRFLSLHRRNFSFLWWWWWIKMTMVFLARFCRKLNREAKCGLCSCDSTSVAAALSGVNDKLWSILVFGFDCCEGEERHCLCLGKRLQSETENIVLPESGRGTGICCSESC